MLGFVLAQAAGGRGLSADHVLSPYIFVFYVSFIVAFLFTPAMRVVANYYGIIDEPDRLRKMHTVPVAYLGGMAVFLGWIAGLAISQFVRLHRQDPGLNPHLVVHFSIVAGACMIILLGLWDDIRGLRPAVKILGQIFAAFFLLIDGIGARCLESIIKPVAIRAHHLFGLGATPEALAPDWLIVSLSSALVIFIIVACCNATNLMDGLDGLCGGVTAIIATGFLFLAVHLAMYGAGLHANADGLRVVLALALLGAVLGFVPYNFNPASIFMGDTGSMFLGFSCATMMILALDGQHPKWFLASLVIFALPIMDTALAFARRYVNGRPLFSADKHHFHHQLVARGFTVKQTVLLAYGLAIFFALSGATVVFMRTRYAFAFYLVLFGSLIVAAYKMGMIHEKPTVARRSDLGTDNLAIGRDHLEASRVIEIREDEPDAAESGSLISTSGAWTPPVERDPVKSSV